MLIAELKKIRLLLFSFAISNQHWKEIRVSNRIMPMQKVLKKTKIRAIVSYVLVGLSVWGVCLFAKNATANFTIARITTNLSFIPHLEMQDLEEKTLSSIETLLKQKFIFLDNGGQSWVFISEDGQYVIKFFKFSFTWYDLFKRLPLPTFLESYRPQMTQKQIGKRKRLLNGYALAYNKMREESLLVATFLNGKHAGQTTVRIRDKIGIEHCLDVKDKPFVIQRTGVSLIQHLAPLMKEGRNQEAQEALCSVLNLIAHRCEQGLKDEDNRLFCNLGFIGKQAVYLDAGAIVEDETMQSPDVAREEILRSANLLIHQLECETKLGHGT